MILGFYSFDRCSLFHFSSHIIRGLAEAHFENMLMKRNDIGLYTRLLLYAATTRYRSRYLRLHAYFQSRLHGAALRPLSASKAEETRY